MPRPREFWKVTSVWPEEKSPYRPIARIMVEPQTAWSEAVAPAALAFSSVRFGHKTADLDRPAVLFGSKLLRRFVNHLCPA
jgi:hypothetical protein